MKTMVKIGDRLVVQGNPHSAYVECIRQDPDTDRIIYDLDWREHGKSKVYAHDENKVWYKYTNSN